MVDVPAVTDPTPSVLVIDRSADRVMMSVSEAVLFPATGSVSGNVVMVAVFVSVAGP